MKILLPYTPSATSEAALDFAINTAKELGGSLIVLASEQQADSTKAADVTDTRPLSVRLEESGVSYELGTVPRRDDPAEDVLFAAFEKDVDLIVIGVRHRTPIGRIIFGSTSSRVIAESPVPVVCVKPEGEGRRPKTMTRGLVLKRFEER